jgi:hypothetical protein
MHSHVENSIRVIAFSELIFFYLIFEVFILCYTYNFYIIKIFILKKFSYMLASYVFLFLLFFINFNKHKRVNILFYEIKYFDPCLFINFMIYFLNIFI